jgi:methylated-DNA-[protein]-cysteine S-methyltransferase
MAQQSALAAKVFLGLKKVPRGQVTTYKILAKAGGRPQAARAIGNILHKNPDAPRVPCHRVVKTSGEVGGYASGQKKKIRLLRAEGVIIQKGKIINLEKYLYNF